MTYDPIQANKPLIAEIEAWCEAHGISRTEFGRLALNDTALMIDLGKGRDIRGSTLHKIKEFMASGRSVAAE